MHSWITRYGRKVGIAAAGLIVGGVLVTAVSASAADDKSPTSSSSSDSTDATSAGANRPERVAEEALTGEKLDQVKDAVLAKYPGATFVRVETDSDGVYEAHITKADSTPATVELDANYAITGEEAGGGHGGHGGPGGRGGAKGAAGAEGTDGVDGQRRGGPGGGHGGPGRDGGSHAAPGTSDGTGTPPAQASSSAPSGSPA